MKPAALAVAMVAILALGGSARAGDPGAIELGSIDDGTLRVERLRMGEGAHPTGRVTIRDGERTLDLASRPGEIPQTCLLLHAREAGKKIAVAVLWVESSSGREGEVFVYALPAGTRVWASKLLARPSLDASSDPSAFAISCPLDVPHIHPPVLRETTHYEWTGQEVKLLRPASPGQPQTPADELSLAARALLQGRAVAAAAQLEAWDRVHGHDPDLTLEEEACVDLLARAYTALRREADLRRTLERQVRGRPDAPGTFVASEALDFIARHSMAEYIAREHVAGEPPANPAPGSPSGPASGPPPVPPSSPSLGAPSGPAGGRQDVGSPGP